MEKILSECEEDAHEFGQKVWAKNSGRTVKVDSIQNRKSDQLKIFSPDGHMELSIRLTESGPVFEIKGASLKIDAVNDVDIL